MAAYVPGGGDQRVVRNRHGDRHVTGDDDVINDVTEREEEEQREEDIPTAMESDVQWRKGGGEGERDPSNEEGSLCTSFTRGLRSLWATKQTEDVDMSDELKIKTTLRELIIYCIFLTTLCINPKDIVTTGSHLWQQSFMTVTFGMSSSRMFYFTNSVNSIFVQTPADPSDLGSTYTDILTADDWFRYASNVLVDGLYGRWEHWYNGANVSADSEGYILYENKLLGVARLRQVRVRGDSCHIEKDFKGLINSCYSPYSTSNRDKTPYGPRTGSAWTYHTADELKCSGFSGQISSYTGDGYYQDLSSTAEESSKIISDLKENLWIDRGTRAVFIDFSLYNPNINLFCIVKLLTEFPATGGAIPVPTFRTVKLLRYVSSMDYFVLVCECIFTLLILYYMVEEALEIKKLRLNYFKSFWNILDLVIIVTSLCCIIFNIYRTIVINNQLDVILSKPDEHANFDELSAKQVQFDSAIACISFFVWIKIFNYISFDKTMTQLTSTLGACSKDLFGFAIIFFIVFFAFAQLGYLLFGSVVSEYCSLEASIFTLFRIILGDFNFQDLVNANRVLGPTYFIVYVFFVFFILLNMFLAIINDTYSEVKADLSNNQDKLHITDYFKRSYYNVMAKLRGNGDIMAIEKALKSAGAGEDRFIEYQEWRDILKMRGYADAEIEAVFSKYDLDGDRRLDEVELNTMKNDLNSQQVQWTVTNECGKEVKEEVKEEDQEKEDKKMTGEDLSSLQNRVDNVELSIAHIISKIESVLIKLEESERFKVERREALANLLEKISESGDGRNCLNSKMTEKFIRDELETWRYESSGMTRRP